MRDWQMLYELQSLPLEEKVEMSKDRIREWYEHFDGQVYVSFSGGKDSTVLLHLVRSMYPDVKAVYFNTGLEDPSVRKIAVGQDNIESIRPCMTFKDIITEYGYPLVSKEVAEAIHYARGAKKLSWRRAQLYGIPEKKFRETLRQQSQLLSKEKDQSSAGIGGGNFRGNVHGLIKRNGFLWFMHLSESPIIAAA